jgi:6-phosphogluconolactonase
LTIEAEVLGLFAEEAAARLTGELRTANSIILTGGTTAAQVYERLPARTFRSGASIFFSDERCVPPDHEASNYAMAAAKLPLGEGLNVHRMRGEDDPEQAAAGYHSTLSSWVGRGIDVALLGLGADCHVAALFPHSLALEPGERLCAAVERPDGLRGLTLTPAALKLAARVFLVAKGRGKAEAVSRLLRGDEPMEDCPARLLADHPRVTLLGDGESIRL